MGMCCENWVKKCMVYEVENPRQRGRPKRTWREVVWEDCQAHKLNTEDAMDRCKWRKMIKDVRWSGWVWVGVYFFWYRPTRVVPDQRPLNGCVCVCVSVVCVCVCVIFLSQHMPIPYRCNLFCCSTKIMSSIPNLSLSSSLGNLGHTIEKWPKKTNLICAFNWLFVGH